MIPIRDTIPSRTPPIATTFIILVNIAVFLLELHLPPAQREVLMHLCGLVPARYTHPAWAQWVGFPIDTYWPFLTHMFLHAGWAHIIFNMWTLWIFGDNVEDRMGHFKFIIFYLICGIFAGIVQFRVTPHSTIPSVGASGAIAGVLGAYFLLYPFARIIIMIPVFFYPFFFEVSAFFYLGFWFLMQLSSGTAALGMPDNIGGIAWWAHIGGFVAGVTLHRFFISRRHRRLFKDEYGLEGAWKPYR